MSNVIVIHVVANGRSPAAILVLDGFAAALVQNFLDHTTHTPNDFNGVWPEKNQKRTGARPELNQNLTRHTPRGTMHEPEKNQNRTSRSQN